MVIPKEVKFIISELKKNGFDAYVVGGCVRDILLKIKPKDWDITTDAKPEEIRKIFKGSFYKNRFGTVTVLTGSENIALKEIEITTYRSEAKYTDKRHPDEIKFAETLEEDLKRRDFAVNAMAIGIKSEVRNPKSETNHKSQITNFKQFQIIDLFGGQKDLKNKIIRAVGNPDERFNEDALRMLRAIRFATVLGFSIEKKTNEAIKKNAVWLQAISKERIRDELVKIIMSVRAKDGIELLRKLGLLKYIIPELEEGYGVEQNKHHIYGCYEHSLLSLDYAARKNFNKFVRFAALLHDIAKPRVKKGDGPDSTFYNHEVVGAKMTVQILNRLKFSKKDIEKIGRLVRYHLFYYNVDEVFESSVRRLVRNVGAENMDELLEVRMADRIGSGCPKAEPFKLRHLRYLIEKVSQDPISPKALKISGNDVMEILEIKPGPKVGKVLDILLGYVLEDPEKNNKKFLKEETERLGKLSEKELSSLAQNAKKEREKTEIKQDEMTKKKYWVT